MTQVLTKRPRAPGEPSRTWLAGLARSAPPPFSKRETIARFRPIHSSLLWLMVASVWLTPSALFLVMGARSEVSFEAALGWASVLIAAVLATLLLGYQLWSAARFSGAALAARDGKLFFLWPFVSEVPFDDLSHAYKQVKMVRGAPTTEIGIVPKGGAPILIPAFLYRETSDEILARLADLGFSIRTQATAADLPPG